MIHTYSMLGQSDSLEGIIFFVIVGIIWLFSAIASAVQKFKKRQRERERQMRPMMNPRPPVPQRAPEPMMSSRKEPRAQRQRSTTVPLQKKSHPKAIRPLPPEIIITEPVSKQPHPSRRRKPSAPPPPPPIQRAMPDLAVRKPSVAEADPSFERSQPRVSTPVALRGWLQPGTLKNQFILTEILQPPLALRNQQGMI